MANDKTSLRRFTMLIALSDIPEDQIISLLRQLRNASITEILDRVSTDRAYLWQEGQFLTDSDANPAGSRNAQSELGSDEVKHIERLLVRETGLSKFEAAEILTRELKMRHPSSLIPNFNSKDGFARWLKQLTSQFTLSEVLHIASALRNKRVHGVGDDWLETNKSSK